MAIDQAQQLFVNNGIQLNIRNQDLTPFVRTPSQWTALALPGINIIVRSSMVTAVRLHCRQPSYVNALLVQSRGESSATDCDSCHRELGFACDRKPFPECRHLPGHFGGVCGKCKWFDHSARCSVQDLPPSSSSDDEGSDNNDDDDGTYESDETFEEHAPESTPPPPLNSPT